MTDVSESFNSMSLMSGAVDLSSYDCESSQENAEVQATTTTSWYPAPAPTAVPQASEELIAKAEADAANAPKDRQLGEVHPIWQSGKVKYLTRNQWTPSIPQTKREACKRERPWGVEVRDLPASHFLYGEQGLFAIAKFAKCDILGEYTGKIVDSNVFGHYVAALEDKGTDESLGIDAQTSGNEMRFINSYLNIAFEPNVTLRTVYIGGAPHLLVVCLRDIDIGEEFLLDYGKGYNEAYLLCPKPQPPPKQTEEALARTFQNFLPMADRSSSDEEDNKDSK